MEILRFLLRNWDSVLLVVAAVVGVIVLVKRGETALLQNLLFALVTRAERELGGGTGQLKRATVIAWVYERLPLVARVFVSPRSLERLLEIALLRAKEKWASDPGLGAYVGGARERGRGEVGKKPPDYKG